MTLQTHLNGALFAEHQHGYPPHVLALHGWGRDRKDLLAELHGREITALDLPGFGASPPPPQPWGAADYAERIADFAAEVSGGPYLVVGHSFGGRIAACFAANHPHLVAGVVFIGVPLIRPSPGSKAPFLFRLARAGANRNLLSNHLLERMRHRYGSRDYNEAVGIMRDILVRVVNDDYSAELLRVSCPVAFLWGRDDSAVPAAVAEEASRLVKYPIRVEIVDGAGHDVHKERPERLSAVLDAVVATSG